MGGVVAGLTIVEAHNSRHIRDLFHACIPETADKVVEAFGGRSGRIYFRHPVHQLRGCAYAGIYDLISDGPQDDTGIILSTVYHVFNIELCPGLSFLCIRMGRGLAEETCVVLRSLRGFPTVKGFVDDHQAQLITDLDQLVCCRVVGYTDGVDAHALHGFHLTLDGTVVCHCAQGSLVMVHAHSVQLHVLAVQVKAFILIHGNPAEAKGSLIRIHHGSVYGDLTDHLIEIRVAHTPKLGLLCVDRLFKGYYIACRDLLGLCGNRLGELIALAVINCGDHHCVCRKLSVICHLCLYSDNGLVLGVMLFQIRCLHKGAVALHVDVVCHHQVYISVDSASGIPAAARLLVVDSHCDDIFRDAVRHQLIGDIIGKRGISVRIISDHLTVYIGGTVHIDAAEINRNTLSGHRLRQNEGLAVPAHASVQITAA